MSHVGGTPFKIQIIRSLTLSRQGKY